MTGSLRAPWALVLAAGQARRFGRQKLAEPLGGKPLIHWTMSAIAKAHAAQFLDGVLVVVRADDDELKRALDPGLNLVSLPSGTTPILSDSLRAGIAALEALTVHPPAGALICLADQPALRADVITSLVMAWRASDALVLRPRYALDAGQPGHPVLVDRACWPMLENAEGDEGLGPLLRQRPELVHYVDVEGENPDVDRVEDLKRFGG